MFAGSIVAIVIPMDEKGNVCWTSLKKLIGYHVASGISAIVSVGTTGESATLNHDEHADAVMMTLKLADGRVPVIAGTSISATAEIISPTQRLNNSGTVGCLTVTPYYNRLSQEGLYQHFEAIAEHTDLSQILYNVPSRTGYDLLPGMMGRLVKAKDIIGIKEVTRSLTRVDQIKELASDDFVLLSGDDASALDSMQLGGHGVISVTANVAMRDMAQMYKLATEGHFAGAHVINQCLMLSYNKLFVGPNPIPTKWACEELGLAATDTLCLPTTPIISNGRETARAALKHTGLL